MKFEAEQLQRNEKEQMLYNQLKAAGVDANSAAGQEISVLVEREDYELEQAQKRVAETQEAAQRQNINLLGEQVRAMEIFDDISEKVIRGQIKSWRDLGQAVIEELQNILIANTRLTNSVDGKGSKSGALGSLLGAVSSLFSSGSFVSSSGTAAHSSRSFLSLAASAARGAQGPGFATGGSFMVGGSGGTDTTPESFMATRGERVTVETPEQQKRSGGGGVYIDFIDARGTSTDAIAALYKMISDLRAEVPQIATGAVQNNFNRKPGYMR